MHFHLNYSQRKGSLRVLRSTDWGRPMFITSLDFLIFPPRAHRAPKQNQMFRCCKEKNLKSEFIPGRQTFLLGPPSLHPQSCTEGLLGIREMDVALGASGGPHWPLVICLAPSDFPGAIFEVVAGCGTVSGCTFFSALAKPRRAHS